MNNQRTSTPEIRKCQHSCQQGKATLKKTLPPSQAENPAPHTPWETAGSLSFFSLSRKPVRKEVMTLSPQPQAAVRLAQAWRTLATCPTCQALSPGHSTLVSRSVLNS